MYDGDHYTALMPATGWRAVYLANGDEDSFAKGDTDEPELYLVDVVAFGARSDGQVVALILEGAHLVDASEDPALVRLLEPSLSEEEANARAERSAAASLRSRRRHWEEIQEVKAKKRDCQREVAR